MMDIDTVSKERGKASQESVPPTSESHLLWISTKSAQAERHQQSRR